MRTIDAFASHAHYADHLIPIWQALPPEARGTFAVPASLRPRLSFAGIETAPELDLQGTRGPVMVAGHPDLRATRKRPAVLVEHGAGQSYPVSSPSHAGGERRGHVRLFICPSERVADMNRAVYPRTRAIAIGCPRLDEWIGKPIPEGNVVAVAFHWKAALCPESGTAFTEFAQAVAELAKTREVIGHGHPRAWRWLEPFYAQAGIEPVREFSDVVDRASLLVVDNSSVGWEWLALDRPVLWLNSRTWRKRLEAWPRFWELADSGVQCSDPAWLPEAVQLAELDLDEQRARRHEAAAEIYAVRDGTSAARAAAAIMEELT